MNLSACQPAIQRRVVFIVQSLKPSGRTDTVRDLMAGMQSHYACECWSLDGSSAEGFNARLFLRKPGLSPRLLQELVGALREVRPAVVHTHGTVADAYGLPAARIAGVPAIVSTLHRGDKSQEAKTLSRLRNKAAYAMADRVVTVSSDQFQHMQRHYAMGRLWTLIPVGVDLRRFTSISDAPNLERPRVILCTGHLRKERNHETILRAFALIAARFHDVELWCAGKPEENRLAELTDEAKRLGITEQVRFLGMRTDVEQLLARCCIGVHAALYDALPRSLIEYSAAARPVVATRIGGVGDIIRDGETGCLYLPGSHEECASALARLLEDSDLAMRMGKAGREWAVSRFSQDAMIARYLDLYDELLGTRKT